DRESEFSTRWDTTCSGRTLRGSLRRSQTSWRRASVPPVVESRPTDYEDAPFRWFHLRVALGASGGEFSEGFGLGIIGICLNRAAPQLDLNPVWMGGLGAASRASL